MIGLLAGLLEIFLYKMNGEKLNIIISIQKLDESSTDFH